VNAILKDTSAMNDTTRFLDMRAVTKQFGDFTALDAVDFSLSKGEVVAMIGPSGSGKSTLLRCINMLELIDAGSITFKGEVLGTEMRGTRCVRLPNKTLDQQRRYFGMVFQGFHLFPHYSALDNVLAGPCIVGRKRKRDVMERGKYLLSRVGLADRMHPLPGRTVRRTKAARRDCARTRDGARSDAVRRAHQCARSGTRQRSAQRDQGVGARGHHDGCRHARDGICAQGGEPRGADGRRPHRR
jgi:ABC-type ATPase involved in cell division